MAPWLIGSRVLPLFVVASTSRHSQGSRWLLKRQPSGLHSRKAGGRNPKGPTSPIPDGRGHYLECIPPHVPLVHLTQACISTNPHPRVHLYVAFSVTHFENEVLCTILPLSFPTAHTLWKSLQVNGCNSHPIPLMVARSPSMSTVPQWAFTTPGIVP